MHLFHHPQHPQQEKKVKVKICGIRRLESAQAALKAGADLLGFNFVNASHSYINPITAKEIIEKVHKHAQIVGVFKDITTEEINELSHYLKLHFVQLQGEEHPSFLQKIRVKVIKQVALPYDFGLSHTIPQLQKFNAEHIMLDRSPLLLPEDYEKEKEIASHLPVFIRGLNPANVSQAVAAISPYGVDAAEGIETNGYEDIEKIHAFITNAKSVML